MVARNNKELAHSSKPRPLAAAIYASCARSRFLYRAGLGKPARLCRPTGRAAPKPVHPRRFMRTGLLHLTDRTALLFYVINSAIVVATATVMALLWWS